MGKMIGALPLHLRLLYPHKGQWFTWPGRNDWNHSNTNTILFSTASSISNTGRHQYLDFIDVSYRGLNILFSPDCQIAYSLVKSALAERCTLRSQIYKQERA